MTKKPQRPDARERSFGLSVGTVLLLIAAYMLWRERLVAAQALGGVGAILVVLGSLQPRLLRRPSDAWWKLAAVLGYVNARLILTAIFVFVLTPIGLLWRVIGRDPLTTRRASWPGWSPHPARYRDRAHYTRMY
jgi:hypothetical protein